MATDNNLLARIDENVKYLRQSFDEHRDAFERHVDDDKRIANDFVKPLWEESQQRRGARHMVALLYSVGGGIIALVGSWVAKAHQ